MKDTANRLLLIYPRLGIYDRVVQDMPLSLIYAARIAQRKGFSVTIIDQRLTPDWQGLIQDELKKAPLLAGISVMTGRPIASALEISKFIKDNSSVPVVWGGIHPTILPEQTLANKYIDIVVRGEGEIVLSRLAEALLRRDNSLAAIPGISFKQNNRIMHNPAGLPTDFNELPLPDYALVHFNEYTRFNSDERYFSLITSNGCPHRCGFCYSVSYDKRKWLPEPVERTIEHMEVALNRHHPTYFSVIDSDFFVDPGRVYKLFELIEKKGWKLKYGFRGARVDDLFKIDERLFSLMQSLGVKHLQIGAESGSQRMLDLMQKDIRVEDTIELNRRLRKYSGIIPAYNFFSGIPTETEDDIKLSTNLIMRLIKENPHCLITAYNQFTPYPGTALFDLAVKYGLKPPEALEEWIEFDQSSFASRCPWLSEKRKTLLDMLYVTTLFVDRKVTSLFTSRRLLYKILRILALLYYPLAKFRLRHHCTLFFLEGKLKRILNERE